MNNKQVVEQFIEQIWNKQKMDVLDSLVHKDYRDHSFLPSVPPNREGLVMWIRNTSAAFNHHTSIEDIVAEGDQVAIRVLFSATHIGTWRGIAASGKTATVKGFRFFRLKDGKIIEHHALIDGEALQSQLTEVYAGCQVNVQ